MWACKEHIKTALALMETPHIRKVPFQIKCSMCHNTAIAKLYYTHQPTDSTIQYFQKQSG